MIGKAQKIMRILFDARMLDRFHGIGRYVYNLVCWGLEHHKEVEVAVLSRRPERWSEALQRWPRLSVFACASLPFSWQEQIEIPRRIHRYAPDLVHFPSLAVPLWCPVPYVVTVHDLIPWHFGRRIHRLYLSTISRWTTRRARRVVAVSRYTATELQHRLGLSEAHLRTIFNGGLDGQELGTAPAGLPFSQPYVLCVTNPRPHKNLDVLLDVWQNRVFPCELLVVGPASEAMRTRLSGVHRVRLLSDVSDSHLAVLYRNALAVVVPSLYEGFGLPALEALQCGAPLICSDSTSLPEVVGEAGLYFDPHDREQLASRLTELVQSSALRAELSAMGPPQAAKFSWERSAREHWELYGEVLRRG